MESASLLVVMLSHKIKSMFRRQDLRAVQIKCQTPTVHHHRAVRDPTALKRTVLASMAQTLLVSLKTARLETAHHKISTLALKALAQSHSCLFQTAAVTVNPSALIANVKVQIAPSLNALKFVATQQLALKPTVQSLTALRVALGEIVRPQRQKPAKMWLLLEFSTRALERHLIGKNHCRQLKAVQ